MMPMRVLLAGWMGFCAFSSAFAAVFITVPGTNVFSTAVPFCARVDLSQAGLAFPDRLALQLAKAQAGSSSTIIPAQFQPDSAGSLQGRICWILPAGTPAGLPYQLVSTATAPKGGMKVQKDDKTGLWNIIDGDKPVMGYQYLTNEPGALLSRISAGNLKYARARSDYIHPLYGPGGEILTKDWPVDHPHHRGIYWAWPEVDYQGKRGDLHALQQVWARPTGRCSSYEGPVFSEIEAENIWLWEDREPIVKEQARIRAWHATDQQRCIDLEFQFTALKDKVSIARRETDKYGGLNIRLAAVLGQKISYLTNAPGDPHPMAAGLLTGVFQEGNSPVAMVVLQSPSNPDYPGDWIQYPEINWYQPTFPASKTRFELKKDRPLTLHYRVWLGNNNASTPSMKDLWLQYSMCQSPIVELK